MNQFYKFEADHVVLADGHKCPLGELPPMAELDEAAQELLRAGRVVNTLKRAVLAFESGGANYRDCFSNVIDLQTGVVAANTSLARVLSGVATFFVDGTGPFPFLPPDARMNFAAELIRELRSRHERPKVVADEAPKAE